MYFRNHPPQTSPKALFSLDAGECHLQPPGRQLLSPREQVPGETYGSRRIGLATPGEQECLPQTRNTEYLWIWLMSPFVHLTHHKLNFGKSQRVWGQTCPWIHWRHLVEAGDAFLHLLTYRWCCNAIQLNLLQGELHPGLESHVFQHHSAIVAARKAVGGWNRWTGCMGDWLP